MKPYDIGKLIALEKLALYEKMTPYNFYPGIPTVTPMVGESATGNYDELREALKQRDLERAFSTFDRKTSLGDDNRTDFNGSAPVTGGSEP